jgi:hypothetical protein
MESCKKDRGGERMVKKEEYGIDMIKVCLCIL